jgi:predicted site-specific integrase-resolvase
MKTVKEEYLDVKDAAILAHVSERTMRRWIREGKISYERFPRAPKGRIFINKLEIPTFLRNKHEDEINK